MSRPILFYDKNCPVCSKFKKYIESKVGNEIEFKDSGELAKKFKYVDKSSNILIGKDALKKMIEEFPTLTGGLSILPEAWRVQVTNVAVVLAGKLREMNQKIQKSTKKGGCNCGKQNI